MGTGLPCRIHQGLASRRLRAAARSRCSTIASRGARDDPIFLGRGKHALEQLYLRKWHAVLLVGFGSMAMVGLSGAVRIGRTPDIDPQTIPTYRMRGVRSNRAHDGVDSRSAGGVARARAR